MDARLTSPVKTLPLMNWRDLIGVTKPRVVSLIVFTALVGMLLAVPGWPPFGLLCAATVGIGCAAASAAAFNHLLDRSIDAQMLRTRYRPLPQGHLLPWQVLSWAWLLATVALIVLVFAVNGLTTVLTFASLIGYGLVYTRFLKKITPQNIVIGGAAGAAPPVLGWAAMTDHISAVSLSLFMIIFAWTPPHFWSLAIGRRSDYERAGIPMLPVTHGERFTILQIVLYTILLIAISYLPGLLGDGGWIYLAGVTALNGGFLAGLVRLARASQPVPPALALFRYSIWYLSLLFALLLAGHYLAPPWGSA
jgi:protoheme IX farnesyltransferase